MIRVPTDQIWCAEVMTPLGHNVAASASYDRERVIDCLDKAGFGERPASMPGGLDTYLYKELDDNGVDVSGGEAQKIAIARALYKILRSLYLIDVHTHKGCIRQSRDSPTD